MKVDVYNETVSWERREYAREFLGAVEVENPTDCLRKVCAAFFAGDEGWFRQCGRVFRHGKQVKLRGPVSGRPVERDWHAMLAEAKRALAGT
jgi:hypothetical protein